MSDHQLLQEITQRITRLESRLVQLGDYVGANLRSKQRIDVILHSPTYTTVEIDALDVSLSRVINELSRAGAPYGAIPILMGGVHVAIVHYQPESYYVHS